MKKSITIVLAICIVLIVALFVSTLPAYAQVRGGVIGPGPGPGPVGPRPWVGPGWGPWVGLGWWGPWWVPPAYPYYDYERPPVIIEQQPPIYEQQTQQQEEQYYWYYCAESKAYYPYVKQCPKGWMKVLPTPVPAPAK